MPQVMWLSLDIPASDKGAVGAAVVAGAASNDGPRLVTLESPQISAEGGQEAHPAALRTVPGCTLPFAAAAVSAGASAEHATKLKRRCCASDAGLAPNDSCALGPSNLRLLRPILTPSSQSPLEEQSSIHGPARCTRA
eukprot:scaffold16670_cov110-Isochrysis_galbana.AAC.5